jgi:uncharacterized protein
MRVLVSGSSGLVGSALRPALSRAGHRVGRLVRSGVSVGEAGTGPAVRLGADDVTWDPIGGSLDAARLEGLDAVVNLAGASIAHGRWTAARKETIRRSRVDTTQLLSATLATLARPPKVMVSASAVGYYGDRGEELLDESAARGRGFLPALCVAWESATERAEKRGIRVVHLRFGVILSATGGALAKMLPPFRLGLGGNLGSGRQYVGWIAMDDAIGAIQHALARDSLRGPVNVVSPTPVTNGEFTRALGRALRRPTVLPLPAFAARLLFGEMADALLLASGRVSPAALRASGYRFQHPDLDAALRHLLAP